MDRIQIAQPSVFPVFVPVAAIEIRWGAVMNRRWSAPADGADHNGGRMSILWLMLWLMLMLWLV
jgi:hypothetical protein